MFLYLSQNVGEVRKKRKGGKNLFFLLKVGNSTEFHVIGLIISEFWAEQKLKRRRSAKE